MEVQEIEESDSEIVETSRDSVLKLKEKPLVRIIFIKVKFI